MLLFCVLCGHIAIFACLSVLHLCGEYTFCELAVVKNFSFAIRITLKYFSWNHFTILVNSFKITCVYLTLCIMGTKRHVLCSGVRNGCSRSSKVIDFDTN